MVRIDQMMSAETVLITVIEAKGSTPREAGTRMAVTAENQHGTIGGGRLEFEAVNQARKLLADPLTKNLTQKYALGPLLEQCCGGSVVLDLSKIPLDEAVNAVKSDGPGANLYMFGAGHVGRAVARALAPLDFNTLWTDSRDNEFPAEVPSGCTKNVCADPVAVVEGAKPGSMFLVFTHSHQLDYAIAAAALARGDAIYCGLIGSMTKRARFEKRLLDEVGIDESRLALLTCPIGVPGIDGKEPEVIAASVAAQLLTHVTSELQRSALGKKNNGI